MKLLKFLIIIICFVSCASLVKYDYISKKDAYKINKNYIKEKYNVDIDDKNAGFVIKKGIYNFKTTTKDAIYEVKIDFKGKIIN